MTSFTSVNGPTTAAVLGVQPDSCWTLHFDSSVGKAAWTYTKHQHVKCPWAEAVGQDTRKQKCSGVGLLPCYLSLCTLGLLEWHVLCHTLLDLVSYFSIYLCLYLCVEILKCFGSTCWMCYCFPSCILARCIFVCAQFQLLQEMMKVKTWKVFSTGWAISWHLPSHCVIFLYQLQECVALENLHLEKFEFVFKVIKQREVRPHNSGYVTGVSMQSNH